MAAAALVVLNLAAALADGGISHGIIAKQTSDPGQLSSLYWSNVILGATLSILIVASAPAVTAYFGMDELAGLLYLGAAGPFIAAFGQQFSSLMQKDLIFSRLATVDVVSSSVGTTTAIVLAFGGAGAASIVGGFLAQATSRSIQLCVIGWSNSPPQLRLRRRDLDGYLSFGLNYTGTRIANHLSTNVDYILIGGFLGPAALGVYSIAYRLVTLPQLRLNPVLTRITFPIFARRANDDAALRRGLLESTRIVGFVTFPLLAGLAVTAPFLVPAVFGAQWEDSIVLIQILTIPGAIFALGNLQGSVFLAKDRADIGFKLHVVRLVLLVAALLPAVQIGIEAVAWAFVGVVAVMFAVTRVVLWRVIRLSFRAYVRALRAPTAGAITMVAIVMAATPLLETVLTSDLAVLAAQVLIGVLGYAGFVALTSRVYAVKMWRLFVSRGPRQAPSQA